VAPRQPTRPRQRWRPTTQGEDREHLDLSHRLDPPESRTSCDVRIDEDGNVTIDGREAGDVRKGINGEWFHVARSRIAEAYPLGCLDNKRGTGHHSPLEAALAGLNLDPR